MKKNYKIIFTLSLFFSLSLNLFSQSFTENFDTVATLNASGWVQQNLSTPIGTVPDWIQGNISFPSFNGAPNSYITANYNSIVGAGTISNWLFTPNRVLNNGDIISFYTRTSGGTFPDRLQVRLSTNGTSVNAGVGNTTVGDFTTLLLDINPTLVATSYPSVWTQYTVTISGLAVPTSGRIAFRYFVTDGGPSGTNSDVVAIDDFIYTSTPPLTDYTVNSSFYSTIPESQFPGLDLNVSFKSFPDQTDVYNVKCSIALPNLTLVHTDTISVIDPAPISQLDEVITFLNFGNLNVGQYILAVYEGGLSYFANPDPNDPNTILVLPTLPGKLHDEFHCSGPPQIGCYWQRTFSITDNLYSRDNNLIDLTLSESSGTSVIAGNTYEITSTAFLDSVFYVCSPGPLAVGDSVRVIISPVNTGIPSNSIIGQSNNYIFSAIEATTSPLLITVPVTNLIGQRLELTPGTYFIGLEKFANTDSYGLNCSDVVDDNIDFAYAKVNNGSFVPINTLIPGNYVPIIRAYLNEACTNSTSSVNANVCNGGSYTYADGTTSTNIVANESHISTLIGLAASGCDSVVTENITSLIPPTNGIVNVSICYGTGYTYEDGTVSNNITLNESHSSILPGASVNMCDSSVVENITVLQALDASITVTSPMLTSNQTGASYQWIDCNNSNAPIFGENSQALTATVDGSYAVEVTIGACTETSACETIVILGLTENTPNYVSIYPNPTNGLFTITLSNLQGEVNYTITTLEGRIVKQFFNLTTNNFEVDLSNESKGVYLLRINEENLNKVYKIVRQ